MKGKNIAAMLALPLIAVMLISSGAAAVDLNAPLPKEVIDDNGWGVIKKIYELPKDVDQATLPIKDIVVGGIPYTCTDVLREEIAQEDEKAYSEVFTEESKTNDDATIAALMPTERAVKTDDGYTGTLKLDPSTILAESIGQTKNSRKVSLVRVYQNQASMDISYLPMTVTDSGRDYTLVDVDWKEDNSYNGDDYEVGMRYTATVKYERDAISYSDDGFTITATYNGTITRAKDALLRYSVIFTKADGEAVPSAVPNVNTESYDAGGVQTGEGAATPLVNGVAASNSTTELPEESEAASSSGSGIAWILIIAILLVLGGVGFFLYKTGRLHFSRYSDYSEDSSDEN